MDWAIYDSQGIQRTGFPKWEAISLTAINHDVTVYCQEVEGTATLTWDDVDEMVIFTS